jgi:hypothetical protein
MKQKSKKVPSPQLMTIGSFAMAVGADRRTVLRRILARAIEPAGRKGKFDTYHIDDLKATLEDDEPRRSAPVDVDYAESVKRNELYRLGQEHAQHSAVRSVGEAIPTVIEAVLRAAGVMLHQKKLDALTLNVWRAIGLRIEADRPIDDPLVTARVLESEQITEWPEALQPIVTRLRKQS